MSERTTWDPSDIAEAGPDDDAPARRRLSKEAWPLIVAEFKAGKSMNALAREHDCTPSSIRHVLAKSGALDGARPDDAPPAEPVVSAEPVAPLAEPVAAAPSPASEPAAPVAAPRPAPAAAAPTPVAAPAVASVSAVAPAPAAATEPAQPRRLSLKPAEPVAPPARPAAPPPRAEMSRQPFSSHYSSSQGNAAPAAAVPPAAPRDGEPVAARLDEAAAALSAAWREWCRQPGAHTEDERLGQALHAMRKAMARVEIEQASTRRASPAGNRPLPKPGHRLAPPLTDDPETAY